MFGLSQNDYLLEPCENCAEPVGLRIGWLDERAESSVCERCSTIKHWPANLPRDAIAICYGCLRAGRAAIDHDTEVGEIGLAHALRGMAQSGRLGIEIARREGLPTTVLKTYDDGSESIGVHLPKDLLFEMLRTPRHAALQREYWPYHCRDFMAYLGQWQQEDFELQAPGRGREWFGEHMPADEAWEDMWEWLPEQVGWSYVYQCQTCGRHQVFVDSD